jgi:uncharacterized protein (DUF362 family)
MNKTPYLDKASEILRTRIERRSFLGGLLTGTAGTAFGTLISGAPAGAKTQTEETSVVSFTTGNDRRELVHQTLEPLERDIRRAVKGKQVVIKPNLVGNDQPLCATHPDAIRGVLDFLKPFYKRTVLIAESTGRRYNNKSGTFNHFELYNYPPLEREYNAKLVDLNTRPTITEWVVGAEGRPLDIRTIDIFQDPDAYIISLCRLKTHNALVVTLSAKNVLFASPINDDIRHEKQRMHSVGTRNLNFNVFLLARKIQPDLAVIDGFEGMEGNGPTKGTPVDHRVALASADFVAADRVGCMLMGVDFGDVGYLTYCANAGLGRGDLSAIHIIGPDPAPHVIPYALHENIAQQLEWKN